MFKNKFEPIFQPLHILDPLHTTKDHTSTSLSPIVVLSTPIVHILSIPVSTVTSYQAPSLNFLVVMTTRYTPLVLLTQLHDLPQAYSQMSRTFGAEGDIIAQQHLDRFNDFCDLEEVYYEDAKMILFAQSFSGYDKKWLRGLQARSNYNF